MQRISIFVSDSFSTYVCILEDVVDVFVKVLELQSQEYIQILSINNF